MPSCRASCETAKKDVRVHDERKTSAFGDKNDGDPVHGRWPHTFQKFLEI